MSQRTRKQSFAQGLKLVRKQQRISQETLANLADISTRHLSFLENGRALPRRAMVLKLASAMNLPFELVNELLNLAGFSEEYDSRDLTNDDMEPIKATIDMILYKHNPYPAVVADRYGNARANNESMLRYLNLFVSRPKIKQYSNTYELMFMLDGMQPYICNWKDVSASLLNRLRQELISCPNNQAQSLFERLSKLPHVSTDWLATARQNKNEPLLEIEAQKGATRIRTYSTITTFSNPFNSWLQGLRIECFYPADQGSRSLMETGRE